MGTDALHYPGSEPPEHWLETAAVYWPSIARLRPPGAQAAGATEHPLTRMLDDEFGLFVDIDPREAARAVRRRFLAALESLTGRLPRLGPFPPEEVHHVRWDPEGGFATLLWRGHADDVGLGGMSYDALTALGLERDTDDPLAPWLIAHDRLAEVYLCAVAEELARRSTLTPVTSHDYFHVVTNDWTAERIITALLGPHCYSGPPRPSADAVGLLTVPAIMPAAWQDVPADGHAELRRRHGADFAAVRRALGAAAERLAGQLAGVLPDAAQLEACLHDEVGDRFVWAARELGDVLRELGLKAEVGTLTAAFEIPAASGTGLASLLADRPLTAGDGAAAVGVAGTYGTARHRRRGTARRSSVNFLDQRGDGGPPYPPALVRSVVRSLGSISGGHTSRLSGWS